MRFARPRSTLRALHAVAAAALVRLAVPGAAGAAGFHRDETPLPSAVTGAARTAGASGGGSGSGGSAFGRLAIGLVVVVALIFAIRWIVRRANGSKLPGATGKLTVVATAPLGPARAVHLLRVGPELVLVGSAEQGVTALRVYDADEALDVEAALSGVSEFAPLAPSGTRGMTAFVDELRKRTARK